MQIKKNEILNGRVKTGMVMYDEKLKKSSEKGCHRQTWEQMKKTLDGSNCGMH